MGSVFRRGLFWRVYLTLLASLVLVAVLAAFLMHQFAEKTISAVVNVPALALGALAPGKDAPPAELEDAARRISAATKSKVVIADSRGVAIAAAQSGLTVAPPAAGDFAASHARRSMSPVWSAPLAGGRTVWVGRPRSLGPGGPHILGMLLAAATAVGLAAFPAVSRLTRRLETLRSSLDAWGEGRLDSRAKVDGRDEIAAVAASFNAAADRVEALLEAHKTLLAHASHELRSPLARLRIAVDMFTTTPDPGLRPEIIRDIDELSGLVDEILFASRLEQATVAMDGSVDCLELAAEEAARAGVSVLHPGPAETSFKVAGSSRLLRRLIRNLIENAVRHGGPPVEVELIRAEGASQITISVNDRGPGIPQAEAEGVFEPFYRPSGRPETSGSWGLGLSIVRQIAERHGGAVSCQARPGGGASFVVTLPGEAR
jgi:signal transduction histidine kinase